MRWGNAADECGGVVQIRKELLASPRWLDGVRVLQQRLKFLAALISRERTASHEFVRCCCPCAAVYVHYVRVFTPFARGPRSSAGAGLWPEGPDVLAALRK